MDPSTLRGLLSTFFGGISLEEFLSIVELVVLVIPLFFIVRQVRLQTVSNFVTLVDSIDRRWSEEPMLRARKEFCVQWRDGKCLPDPTSEYIMEFFEQLAIYVKNKAIPLPILWDTHSVYIEYYYNLLIEEITTIQKEKNDPTWYCEFSELYRKINGLTVKKGGDYNLDETDLKNFVEREIKITSLSLSLKERKRK